jgi:azobenzene reductase
MKRVLILIGSSTRNSHTLNLAKIIQGQLNDEGLETNLIDLVEYQLPQYDLTTKRDKFLTDPKVANFIELTKQSEGYIWGTPVYHGSYSGILKNALDWQDFSLTNKIVGLISNGNDRGSMAVDHLTLVARAQHAISLPTRICTDAKDYNQNNQLVAQDLLPRINDFCKEFALFINKFP